MEKGPSETTSGSGFMMIVVNPSNDVQPLGGDGWLKKKRTSVAAERGVVMTENRFRRCQVGKRKAGTTSLSFAPSPNVNTRNTTVSLPS